MEKFEIKNKLKHKNLHDRYLITNLLVGIERSLELDEIKADKDISSKLESFKKDLLDIPCPVLSNPKKVIINDQEKAYSIGSRAYILIANYIED